MKRLLFLSTCLVASMFCAEEPQLRPICQNDTFDFERRQVNSYIAMQLNFSFPKLEELLLEQDLYYNFRNWATHVGFRVNATELQQLISHRDEFNRIVNDFYQQDKINKLNATDILKTRKAILKIRSYFASWHYRLEYGGEQVAWIGVMDIHERMNKLLQNLLNTKNGKLNEKIVSKGAMHDLQLRVSEKLTPGQYMAFDYHVDFYPYIERILRFDNVTVSANESQLFASVVFPISNTNKQPTGACTSASELPPFYREYLL